MKRILRIFLCLLIILMASCKSGVNDGIEDFFGRNVVFETMGIKYEYEPQNSTFTVLSGDYSGMKLFYTDTDCTVNFKDFTITTDPFSFPQLKLFYSLFCAYGQSFADAVKNDGGAYVLLIDSFRFLVYYNSVSEKVEKLSAQTENGSFEYKVLTSED